MVKRAPRSWLAALVAALTLLLVLLGWLQWGWVRAVVDAEALRTRRAVATGVGEAAAALSAELDALQEHWRDARGVGAGPSFLAHHQGWQGRARWPGLVRELAWIDGANPGRPLCLDPATGELRSASWEGALAPWGGALASVGASHSRIELPAAPPGLLVPRLDPGGQPSFVLLLLDEGHLASVVLPELQLSCLDPALAAPARLELRRGDGELIGAAGPEPERPGPADAVVKLGTGGEMELASSAGRGELELRQGGSAELTVVEGVPSPTTPRTTLQVVPPPPWELSGRHVAGSAELAAAAVGRRQLGVGLGALVVLAAATALLFVAGRRERRLARRQVEFLAGVTHELRTPLTVIRSAADNLAEGVVSDDARTREYGGIVRHEARRLSDLVEQALAMAGARAAAPAEAAEELDLRCYLEDVVERHGRGEGGTPPELEVAGGIELLRTRPRLLEQALANLLGNAAKYAGPGAARGLRAEPAGNGGTRLVVWDEGPGLAPGEEARVFEPFRRGRRADESRAPGNGLGLGVARQAAEALGGTLSYSPGPGGGARFTITLPGDPP